MAVEKPSASTADTGWLRVTQVRSAIGTKPKHRGTLRALGLRGIGKTNVLPDRPEIRGMLARVPHLIDVTPAGGAARHILEMAGIRDILAKSLGSSNGINVAHATIAGLKSLRRPDEVAALRGKSADEVTPGGVLRAYRERKRETDLFAAETR